MRVLIVLVFALLYCCGKVHCSIKCVAKPWSSSGYSTGDDQPLTINKFYKVASRYYKNYLAIGFNKDEVIPGLEFVLEPHNKYQGLATLVECIYDSVSNIMYYIFEYPHFGPISNMVPCNMWSFSEIELGFIIRQLVKTCLFIFENGGILKIEENIDEYEKRNVCYNSFYIGKDSQTGLPLVKFVDFTKILKWDKNIKLTGDDKNFSRNGVDQHFLQYAILSLLETGLDPIDSISTDFQEVIDIVAGYSMGTDLITSLENSKLFTSATVPSSKGFCESKAEDFLKTKFKKICTVISNQNEYPFNQSTNETPKFEGFGAIYDGEMKQTNSSMHIKVCKTYGTTFRLLGILKETRLHQKLLHPNIVGYNTCYVDSDVLTVKMTFPQNSMQGIDMCVSTLSKLNETEILGIELGYLSAIKTLHDKHIVVNGFQTSNFQIQNCSTDPVPKLANLALFVPHCSDFESDLRKFAKFFGGYFPSSYSYSFLSQMKSTTSVSDIIMGLEVEMKKPKEVTVPLRSTTILGFSRTIFIYFGILMLLVVGISLGIVFFYRRRRNGFRYNIDNI